jgi:hypothetical protein
MNCLSDQALAAWNAKAGPNDPAQRRLKRRVASKPMMTWSEILRDANSGKLNLNDAEDRQAPVYRELDDEQCTLIRDVVARLCHRKWWSAPAGPIDKVLSFNKGELKQWFKEHTLTTGYLMGAPE